MKAEFAEAIFGASESPHAAWELPAAIGDDEMSAARLAPRCIVENYLFADVAALIAPGSTGKTTMSLHEAMCVALGRRLWGLQVRNPGPVLFITAEDRREFLVARLREICAAMGLTAAEQLRARSLIRIDDRTSDLRRLTAIVGDVVVVSEFAHEIVRGCTAADFRPALIQFDPMVSFGVGESRVNDAEQGLIHAARVMSAGLDCAVRYVHHTGVAKALEKASHQYAGRGGSALADGSRMVHVMASVDAGELYKATGEQLGEGQSAFALYRPKISYAAPQTSPLFVRRAGFRFEVLRPVATQSSEERAQSIGMQLGRFIEAEFAAERQHSRNTLAQLKPDNLSRDDVRIALAWLAANGRLTDAPIVGPDGKQPRSGARSYLRVIGEPSAKPVP